MIDIFRHTVRLTERMFKGSRVKGNICSVLPQKRVFGFALKDKHKKYYMWQNYAIVCKLRSRHTMEINQKI